MHALVAYFDVAFTACHKHIGFTTSPRCVLFLKDLSLLAPGPANGAFILGCPPPLTQKSLLLLAADENLHFSPDGGLLTRHSLGLTSLNHTDFLLLRIDLSQKTLQALSGALWVGNVLPGHECRAIDHQPQLCLARW